MKHLLYAFLFLCLSYKPPALAQDENFLDIVKARQLKQGKEKATRKSKANDRPKFVSPRSSNVMVTHMPPTPKPFEITLLNLDKQSYRMGENCVYEVQLKNITSDLIIIPWSADSEDEQSDDDNKPPGYLNARVSLFIVDGTSERPISGVSISGSNPARGSLKTLKPKELARIRVPGRLTPANFAYEQEMIATLPRKFQIRAYYEISGPKVNWRPENSLSTNSLTIELTK